MKVKVKRYMRRIIGGYYVPHDEHFTDFEKALPTAQIERGQIQLVLGLDVTAELEQELNNARVAVLGSEVQTRVRVVVDRLEKRDELDVSQKVLDYVVVAFYARHVKTCLAGEVFRVQQDRVVCFVEFF